jgi:hypothetical protein
MGISQTNVFAGQNHQPSKNVAGVFPGVDHTGQPVEGRIGIRTAHAFNKGADGVEVGISLFVVEHGPPLNGLFRHRQGDGDGAGIIGFRGFNRQFQGIEQSAGIAIGHIHQMVEGLVGNLDRNDRRSPVPDPPGSGPRPGTDRGAPGLELKKARAADQGLIHLKEGIFGGGPNQNYRAVFDPGQQRILLGFVEAVDLVDKEDGAASVLTAQVLGGGDGLANVFDPGQHGINGNEVGAGGVGDNLGQGGFTGARRTKKNQR